MRSCVLVPICMLEFVYRLRISTDVIRVHLIPSSRGDGAQAGHTPASMSRLCLGEDF